MMEIFLMVSTFLLDNLLISIQELALNGRLTHDTYCSFGIQYACALFICLWVYRFENIFFLDFKHHFDFRWHSCAAMGWYKRQKIAQRKHYLLNSVFDPKESQWKAFLIYWMSKERRPYQIFFCQHILICAIVLLRTIFKWEIFWEKNNWQDHQILVTMAWMFYCAWLALTALLSFFFERKCYFEHFFLFSLTVA